MRLHEKIPNAELWDLYHSAAKLYEEHKAKTVSYSEQMEHKDLSKIESNEGNLSEKSLETPVRKKSRKGEPRKFR